MANLFLTSVYLFLYFVVARLWYLITVLPGDVYMYGIRKAYQGFLVYLPPRLVHHSKTIQYNEDKKLQLSRWSNMDVVRNGPVMERKRQMAALDTYVTAKSAQIQDLCRQRDELLLCKQNPPVSFLFQYTYPTSCRYPLTRAQTLVTLPNDGDLLGDVAERGRRNSTNYGLHCSSIQGSIVRIENKITALADERKRTVKWHQKENETLMGYAYKNRHELLSEIRSVPDKFPCSYYAYYVIRCRLCGDAVGNCGGCSAAEAPVYTNTYHDPSQQS